MEQYTKMTFELEKADKISICLHESKRVSLSHGAWDGFSIYMSRDKAMQLATDIMEELKGATDD